ncbi:MAG TPA: hydantoinase B/oxoprolinase family protein [Ramlibacter sp.]|nr:hydantoinase B/oxoprolinase family protein [Ramlibacter sp.]
MTVLVCSAGFADVLTLQRQNRVDPYAAHVPPSSWLQVLPVERRLEVQGRIDANGREVEPLVLDGLVDRIRAVQPPPRALAISLLFAHRNPVHEQRVREQLQAAFPNLPIACSHEHRVAGGEYECTVAALAAVGVRLPVDPAAVRQPQPLEALADRMQATLVDRAVSTVVREAMDCAAAVFLPDGRLVAQARTLPLLLGSLQPAVQGILAVYPPDAMRDGDGYLSNDPWSGGTHLPDFVLLRPVFANGRLRALLACVLHHQDVGGITPGSVPTDAVSIQQEGLRLPPLRLYRGGEFDEALVRLLCANSRMPENLRGDLAAQWAALDQGQRELGALLDQGFAFEAQAQRALESAERAVRQAIARAPDGQWRFRDALDGDGVGTAPVAVDVVLHKLGDRLQVDLRGCAPQTQGPVNAAPGAVWAAVSYFAGMLATGAPSNGGCTAPLELLTKPGTIVDPRFPAAVNARTNLVKLLANALLGAWAQAVPQEMPAPNAGVAVVLSLGGTRGDGSTWLFTEIIASAAGGAPWGPGGSGVSTDVGNARNTPAEAIEAQAPIRMERVAVRRGSGGAGRHRGGDGVVRVYRLLEGLGVVSYRGERHAIAAQGSAGGGPGACGRARIERADGTVEDLPAKARARWSAGDRLVIETAGAGGWGNPAASAS